MKYYNNIPLVSIGSGNGYLENEVSKQLSEKSKDLFDELFGDAS